MPIISLTRNGTDDNGDLAEARALLVFALYVQQQLRAAQVEAHDFDLALERLQLAVAHEATRWLADIRAEMLAALAQIAIPTMGATESNQLAWLIEYGDFLVVELATTDLAAGEKLAARLHEWRAGVTIIPDKDSNPDVLTLKVVLGDAEMHVATTKETRWIG